MMPVMCGEAIEVPEMVSVRVLTWIPEGSEVPVQEPAELDAAVQTMPVSTEVMLSPGAEMSGLSRTGEPRVWRGPCEEKLARVSLPAKRVMFREPMLAFRVLPSAKVTITEGMVMVGSTPPRLPNTPADELAMITAMAPAFWAFLTLTMKPQVPRSISAMLSSTAAALVSGEQPSVVSGPEPSAGSRAWTTLPVMPAVGGDDPNCAVPTV